MFLPRKLQKRARSSQNAQPLPAAQATEVSDAHREDITSPEPSSAQDVATQTSIPRPSVGTSSNGQTSSAPAPPSSVEAAKLDRLVEFLLLKLSPLSLALAADEERRKPDFGQVSELVANITCNIARSQDESPCQELPNEQPQASRIHLARLLNLVPGLSARCKSITLLSQALQAMQHGPASAWFTLHTQKFQLECSPLYTRITHQLHTAVTSIPQHKRLIDLLAPRLVYIESIPPRIRARSHAATYLINVARNLTQSADGATVLAVLEPVVVDRYLMADSSALPSASALEETWISGRGFLLLDSSEHVELLCSQYQWDLSHRISPTRTAQEKQEPIRCLSWPKWVDMKQLYLQHQRQTQQDTRHRRNPDSIPRDGDTETDANAQQSKPRTTSPTDSWFRATILLLPLPLPPPPNSTLTIPCAPSPHEVTPAWCNRHIKPQLEHRVPESIAYIHLLPTPETGSMVAVRTVHRLLAEQLQTQFPELRRMDETDEETYWSKLPPKVRTAAHRRMLTLDSELAHSTVA